MIIIVTRHLIRAVKILLIVAALILGGFSHSHLEALTLNVVDENGTPVSGFRWLLEEDNTYKVNPGVKVTSTAEAENVLSLSIGRSYAPVADKGNSFFSSAEITTDPAKRYHISVLPGGAYALGGAQVAANQTAVTVVVNAHPIPTAQISIFVFQDNAPINNAPDLPGEVGLANFDILVEDAAGTYGIGGGHLTQDVFGNPLGTTYDINGNVNVMGTGIIRTDADGRALIQNIAPGKYGILVVPPAGQNWKQTSTIEGKKVVDAWVKAGEPPFFQEFGGAGVHVFIGFIQPFINTDELDGTHSISGTVVNLHNSRPPEFTFYDGTMTTDCWIGLNNLAVGTGLGIYAQPCDASSGFTIDNVPEGNYELAIWDANLGVVFAQLGITVVPGGCIVGGGVLNPTCELNNVPVFNWFGRMDNEVFFDTNGNGYKDPGELGIFEQAVNLRFRNGSLYQSLPTDLAGTSPFDEVFPFFHWLVTEVDFTRFKATGATITVDGGGPTGGTEINPQAQKCTQWDVDAGTIANMGANGVPGGGDDTLCTLEADIINPNTGDNLSRTATGEVLTQGFQVFLGQTNKIEWGKGNYGPGENGGISGLVQYATTRAEDDPQFAAVEVWEPGVPRVQVNLYRDADNNGIIDDLNGDGCSTPADVDNHPFGNFPGPEDVKYLLSDPGTCSFIEIPVGTFSSGDAVQITTTDSWDDSMPAGCPGDPGTQEPFHVYGNPAIHAKGCFEGLRTYNQVRDAVFDGGFAFTSFFPGGFNSGAEVSPLANGGYIVETTLPPGYEHLRSQDKNVDFGDVFEPPFGAPIVAVPPCVGEPYTVPDYLTLFPGVEATLAGQELLLCNRKQVTVSSGMSGGGFNSTATFFIFTEVPKAGRFAGNILDDTANEFDPNSPAFGEKFAPPWLPVSIQDWAGNEIGRTYSDEWGAYEALIPSTFTENLPIPSGVSPAMHAVCLNHPGPIEDVNNPGTFITDPFFRKEYSQFCYTFQYMPGLTTYLDTPVVPIGAFAGANQAPLDCEFPDLTPGIFSVNSPDGGPYVSTTGKRLTITSAGMTEVSNPAYDGTNNLTIQRNYGFGAFVPGQSKVTLAGVGLINVAWSNGSISGDVPAVLSPGAHQLMVTRGDSGKTTEVGVTVTIGGPPPIHVASGGSIQDAIDLAAEGDLIIVAPGRYSELLIVWKDVTIQGWGSLSTIIDGVKAPSEKLLLWRDKIQLLVGEPLLSPYLLNGQDGTFSGVDGPAIMILGKDYKPFTGRIDGLTITGADFGGGLYINAFTENVTVSNNRIQNNQGNWGGGIRVGAVVANNAPDSQNHNMNIHHNRIIGNGSLSGAGGGVALYTGSDGYEVKENYICGNFSLSDGGGIGHLGLSDNGLIADNKILFNENFNQGQSRSGGGIFIGGYPAQGADLVGPGAGTVVIDANLLQGNLAGSGDGSAIRAQLVNGQDVEASPSTPGDWYRLDIFNNIIVNNVAAVAGAISLQDAANVQIIHNTIANNDSTATGSGAFSNGPSVSVPQTAGIISRKHSGTTTPPCTSGLLCVIGAGTGRHFEVFSSPWLFNNIIGHNRSFYWDVTENGGIGGLLPDPATPAYNDLAVTGTALPELLDPRYCALTDSTGYDVSNTQVPALPASDFVSEYFNGAAGHLVIGEAGTALQTAPAFDEGGTFIQVRFGPLTPKGDYHLDAAATLINAGCDPLSPPPGYDCTLPVLAGVDFDREGRPDGGGGGGTTPQITSPAPGITLSGSETFNWTANGTPVLEWWLYIGTTAGGLNIYDSGSLGTTTSATVNGLPTNGTVYVRLFWRYDPTTWLWEDFTYNTGQPLDPTGLSDIGADEYYDAATNPSEDVVGPITSGVIATPNPTNGALSVTLTATASDVLTGNANIVAAEWFWDHEPDPGLGLANNMNAADGSFSTAVEIVEDTLTVNTGGGGGGGTTPQITSPTPGITLSGSETFNWTANGTPVLEWWLYIGTTVGGLNIYDSGSLGTTTSATVNGLPTNGTVYVRLFWRYDPTTWLWEDFTYDGSVLDGSALADGNYTIHVRSQDALGNWGAASSTVLSVKQASVSDTVGPSTFAVMADPNPTAGSASITLTAAASDTETGNSIIEQAEWYWDGDNPPLGSGNPMFALDSSFDTSAEVIAAVIDVSAIPDGDYPIHVRSKDEFGNWGADATSVVTVSQPGGGTSGTAIIYQCPTDTTGPGGVPDGISDDPDTVCIHLVAGDGFTAMADGYLQYIFSYKNVSNKDLVPEIPGYNPYNALNVMEAGFLGAELSAPTISVKEGQKLYLTLTNVGMNKRPDLFDSHSVHWHGFPNASAIFDGVPEGSLVINQLASITYFYHPVDPGTYLYHCHVEASEHMQMGMYGNLYVTPAQDGSTKTYNGKAYTKFAYNDGDGSTGYHKDYPLQLSSVDHNFHDASLNVQPLPFADMKDTYALINGRGYPDTANPAVLAPHPDGGGKISQKISSYMEVSQGETILLRLNNMSITEYFTVSVLGIPMKVVGRDTRELVSAGGEKLHYYTSSINLGGGEAADVLLYTDGIPPGTYFLYTTNLNYLSNNTEDHGGMMTEIKIIP